MFRAMFSPETCRAEFKKINTQKLLHLVGYLHRCINDARSHKHQKRLYVSPHVTSPKSLDAFR
jgi:hypothetical protein